MTQLLHVDLAGSADTYCRALEDGAILFLAQTPLAWGAGDRDALLACDTLPLTHKNISYRRDDDRLAGTGGRRDSLRLLMRSYVDQMTALLAHLLAPYAHCWRVETSSYRPQEEAVRALSWKTRNDLLHVDAFPSRPTNGDRILRVFTNLHPTRARCWITTETFDALVGRLLARGAVPALAPPRGSSLWHSVRRRLVPYAPAALAPLARRSPYDAFMLRLHDHLKADAQFQASAPKQRWEFPPGSSWILFTDFVPHAALSGQFALEQTYIVPRAALLQPEKAPVNILERLVGVPLTDRPVASSPP